MHAAIRAIEGTAWVLGVAACAALMAATIALQFRQWDALDRSTSALAAAGLVAGAFVGVRFVLVKVGERKGAS